MQAFDTLTGIAVPFGAANVDTDAIIPARFLKTVTRTGLGRGAFAALRENPDNLFDSPRNAGAPILIAGDNFGCGSSREHAPWALADLGFRAVIAPSFGDIFFSNALKNGLLPVRLPEDTVQSMLAELAAAPGARLRVDLRAQTVTRPGGEVESFVIDPFARHCLLEGLDEIDYTLTQRARIEDFERRRAAEAALSHSSL